MEKKIVEDIMKRDVIFVNPETKVSEVAEILEKKRLHGMPVVEDGKVVGIITEKDFFIKNSPSFYLPSYIKFLKESRVIGSLSDEKKSQMERLLNAKAKDIMTRDCVTVLQGMKINDLINFFKETGFVTFPVVNESDELAGIVTLMDVLKLMNHNV